MEQRRKTPELHTQSLVEAALSYAQKGWPVFPLAGKLPYKGTHGHKDATRNLTEIAAMWREHPLANIGLPTGEASGVIVVDMDVPEGHYNIHELQRQKDVLPETRRSHTANGGLHYFYAYPHNGRRFSGTVGLSGLIGIDVRADGNYVVLPPSRLYGRRYYTWANGETPIATAPPWLLALLTQAEEQRHVSPQGWGVAYQAEVKWFSEAASRATEGNRNQVGFWLACQLRDDGLTELEAIQIILAYANRVPQEQSPYTSKEALASMKSAYSRPPRGRARRL